MEFELLLMLRIWREASSIVNMTPTRYTALPNLDCILLLLLELLVDLLRIALMTWNMHTFLVIIALY